MNRMKVRNLIPYLIGGGLCGGSCYIPNTRHCYRVLLAFVIPFGNGDKKSTSILQHFYINLSAFLYFHICLGQYSNCCLNIANPLHYSIGILGLIVGKPLGIYLLAFLAVSAGYVTSRLNLENGHWRRIFWVELGQYS
jgi:NhaA family Na+:H+ antiporter